MAKIVDFDFNDPVSAGSAEEHRRSDPRNRANSTAAPGPTDAANAVFDGKTGYLEVAPVGEPRAREGHESRCPSFKTARVLAMTRRVGTMRPRPSFRSTP